jgi:hypothetical protein
LPLVGYASELPALQSLLDRFVYDGALLLMVAVVRALPDQEHRSARLRRRAKTPC